MYYKLSGRFSLGGLAMGSVIGCAGAAVLGYVYGRGSILIEDERFAFLATLAFGGLMGLCAGYGMVWGKVRNQTANLIVQAAVSVLGLYVSWAAWITDVFKRFNVDAPRDWTAFLERPSFVWRAMGYINQYGTWTLGKGDPTKGTELWVVWIVEAALVVVGTLAIGYEVLKRHAFCERCESWCRRGAKLFLTAPQNVSLLKRQLEANDWRSLDYLTAGKANLTHVEIVLDSCEQCRQLNTMSLTYTAVTRDKLRRTRMSNTKIVEHLLINPTQAETLKQLSMKVEQAAKLAPPKASAASSGKL